MPLITDPIDLALDTDGDLVMPLRFTSGVEAVAQSVRVRLGRFRGEWFQDLGAGVPYLANDTVAESDALLGQRFNDVRARSAMRAEILSTPGVRELRELAVSFDRATRTMSVSFVADTIYGEIAGEVEV